MATFPHLAEYLIVHSTAHDSSFNGSDSGIINIQQRSVVALPLNSVYQLLVGQFLLLVVYHRKLVGLQFVLLQLHGLRYQIGQLNHVSALGIVLYGLSANFAQLVNGFVVYLGEKFLGAEGLVAYFFYSFEVLGKVAFVLAEVGFYLFDQLVKEHFHDSEVIFELFHDFISDIVVDEQFILLFAEGFGVDFSLLESDVGFIGDHALPLR